MKFLKGLMVCIALTCSAPWLEAQVTLDMPQSTLGAVIKNIQSQGTYEFFCDEYRPFFEKKWTFLLDFDIEIEKKTLELLNYKEVNIELSTRYIEEGEDTIIDLRKELQPKKFDVSLHNELTLPYYQVFDNKYGFTPNLSIVDLLFNMGNESKIYIKKIQKTI